MSDVIIDRTSPEPPGSRPGRRSDTCV